MYLERRRRRWYALHDIPADAQQAQGAKGKKKVRFVRSLDTEDRSTAERRAAILEARWRSDIEEARKGNSDHVERDAAFWRRAIRDAPEEPREFVNALDDELNQRIHRAARKVGIDNHDPEFEALPERQEANRLFAIATGALVRLDEHVDEYLATLSNEPKTVDMKRSTIRKFCEGFTYIDDFQRKDVQRWVNQQAQEGRKAKTIRRILSELRGYWTYLISIEAASENSLPFEKLTIPRQPTNGKADEREPFQPADVVKLHRAAIDKGDQSLANLIELGMWTGGRIEELCALRVAKVTGDCIKIEDAKTPAGWREVPIHSRLCPTLTRLLSASTDGYVLSGLTENKYGDRSNAVGKRFGRLKKAAGFGDEHVFHSIRRTVATLLEDAGVPENVAADIIGHEKATMTYGLYSGGTSLDTRRTALEKITYPVK